MPFLFGACEHSRDFAFVPDCKNIGAAPTNACNKEIPMLIKTQNDGFAHPVPSEITDPATYTQRRDILKRMALGAGGAAMAGWANRVALARLAPLPTCSKTATFWRRIS